jgi:phosphate transport system permease protein
MLALVALPLIVAATREGLQVIPGHVREASYAVGKSKTATIRRILLPTAAPQIATGTILGMGRVIGDTAIIVVLLGASVNFFPVEGSPPGIGLLQGTGSTLTNYVYNNSPTGDGNQPTKAYAAAFVLLCIVLLLNTSVDLINRKWKGPAWRD